MRRSTHGDGCGPFAVLTLGLVVFVLLVVTEADARVNRWEVVKPMHAKILRVAQCESGGRWNLNTGNGFSGGMQFLPSTWRSVGGRGMPHDASKLEQMYRSALLVRRSGWAPWPVCGRR